MITPLHYNDKIYITQLIRHFRDYHMGLKPLWTVKLYKSWTFRARFFNGPYWCLSEGIKKKHKLIAQRTFLQQCWAIECPQTSCKKAPWLQLIVCDKSSVEQRRRSFILSFWGWWVLEDHGQEADVLSSCLWESIPKREPCGHLLFIIFLIAAPCPQGLLWNHLLDCYIRSVVQETGLSLLLSSSTLPLRPARKDIKKRKTPQNSDSEKTIQ